MEGPFGVISGSSKTGSSSWAHSSPLISSSAFASSRRRIVTRVISSSSNSEPLMTERSEVLLPFEVCRPRRPSSLGGSARCCQLVRGEVAKGGSSAGVRTTVKPAPELSCDCGLRIRGSCSGSSSLTSSNVSIVASSNASCISPSVRRGLAGSASCFASSSAFPRVISNWKMIEPSKTLHLFGAWPTAFSMSAAIDSIHSSLAPSALMVSKSSSKQI
mmetsp:Transcript_40044/g.74646  ORF Transcript_40044/g.74646 Transcript_40044/m.74646 type:complete len:217 (+) Transcript_40044:690-1340(+)